MSTEERVQDTILDYIHQAKDLANQYWWDPIEAHEMYNEISELKNVIMSNQTNIVQNEEVMIMESE